MHTVDRGPEPPGLGAVRKKLTPKWIAYYSDKKGKKPTDGKWRDFHADLSAVFFGLCGYCESECKGEVDHFRPKSKYPERVYVWANWILACHTCNHMKGGEWPRGGYVDPCGKSRPTQPESYFDFDTKTAGIVPKKGLKRARHQRGSTTIEDLGLNAYHHRKARLRHLQVVSAVLHGRSDGDSRIDEFVQGVTSRDARFSSITKAWLKEQGHLQ